MKRLLISFSGGRTSAYMTKRLLDERRDDTEYLVVFANTGQEDERTLEFVAACNQAWNLGVVWVEAAVNPERGIGIRAREVEFATASRAGEPFEAMIAKYGIPNKAFPHCSRDLKQRAIEALARSRGWESGGYELAIGIRADEVDRMAADADARRIIYPLVRAGVTRRHVLAWWARQPFRLELPEHFGNCTWCWKKTLRKHLTLAVERPDVFDFPARMEATYPFAGPGEGPHRFFRGNWTTSDIKARARLPFTPFVDGAVYGDPAMDTPDGCVEACDVFGAQPRGSSDLFDALEDAA